VIYILLSTTVCVLLDVGTKPTGTSIYELWKCEFFRFIIQDVFLIYFLIGFDKHSNVGGACGEWVPLVLPGLADPDHS